MRTRSTTALSIVCILFATCARHERGAVSYPHAPVILISIDTLRADHLPMFGYRAVETPHLDSLRGDGVLFTNAYAHVPLTLPSHTTMLTGLLPQHSGVRNNIGYVVDTKLRTMASFLKQQGYETGAAVSAFVLRGTSGLAASFDFYDDSIASRPGVPAGSLQRSGRTTAGIAWKWVEARQGKPFFLFLHLFEPHTPYEPEEPFRSRFASSYDGEIATADAMVGDFLQRLKQRGLYEPSIIILVSDHGEGLSQHGEPEHGIFVYREDIHVPLLVKLPGGVMKGESVASPVGLVDLFPSIAALTGGRPPDGLDGRPLFGEREASRRIYSESLYPRIHLGWSELRSLADAHNHFIQAPRPELYDLRRDPAETSNIVEQERRTYSQMREELSRYAGSVQLPARIDPEEARKLAALGYLSAPAGAAVGPLPDPKDRIGEIASMSEAARLLGEHRSEEAVRAFQQIVERNPRFTDAWNELGAALEAAGRDEEASEVYRKMMTLTPELAGEFGLRRAAVLLRLGQYAQAADHARLAERSNPGGTHLMLARVALARKDFRGAESEARLALADASQHAAAAVFMAGLLAQQGSLQEAMALIDATGREIEAQNLGPIESYHFARGDILARMNRYDEAVSEFQQEISAFPGDRQTYANLYLLFMLRGDRAGALRTIDQMLRAIPGKSALRFAAKTVEALGDRKAAAEYRARAAQEN